MQRGLFEAALFALFGHQGRWNFDICSRTCYRMGDLR
jgi:hypothetical protein